MNIQETSVVVDDGGRSQSVAISGTSAQSVVINANYVLITLTTAAFVRQGADPTALADGTDTYLAGGATYRLCVPKGAKLALITAGPTGTAYITPGA